MSASPVPASITTAVINVKGKAIHLMQQGDLFGIRFEGRSSVGYLNFYAADVGLTMMAGAAYLDTGTMLFGPIDDDAARIICGLISPVIH